MNGDAITDYPIKINGSGFNFENPTDSGGTAADDRIYVIKLFANDGVTQAEIELSVEVTDVSEGPTLSSHNFNLTIGRTPVCLMKPFVVSAKWKYLPQFHRG